jgi:hypothetical protein
VTVDGRELAFDQPPIMVNNRVLVPMRKIFEVLGATVEWNESESKVTATHRLTDINPEGDAILANRVFVMKIGDDFAYLNGYARYSDTQIILENGRTMLPVRFVSELLNHQVERSLLFAVYQQLTNL